MLSYFLVAVAISCGKHDGQLGIQSREKAALKVTVTAKNTAEESSNRLNKKKRKKKEIQLSDVLWDRWIRFCRFFFPILLLQSAASAGAQVGERCCPITCGLFEPAVTSGYGEPGNERTVTIPFTLPAGGNLNESYVKSLLSDFRTTLSKVDVWSYPEEVRKEACHIFADLDVDITSSTLNSTDNSIKCVEYLDRVNGLSSLIDDILSSEKPWDIHWERLENYRRKTKGCRTKFSRRGANGTVYYFHADATLVEKSGDNGVWNFHTWGEKQYKSADISGENRAIRIEDSMHYYSPQSKFREIIKKHENNPLRFIKECQKQGGVFLKNPNLEGFCEENPHFGAHLVSVGGEFLYVADYEKARQRFRDYLDRLL
ncbi:hypothetical protein [Candidatus Cardinium hertigii]|uniref:hypothetical protein n=1 Tax=Candidatus Cardinium hertigii TaxID=247481 RepID=UPI0013A5ACA2|nr:hypothetical protein [Candidatus Cardinium hertigii]